jgi:LAO/AO transport system kinase
MTPRTEAPKVPPAIATLMAAFDAGHRAALARAISIVENHREGFDSLLGLLHARLGRARRIGITGPPGAGKSTITTALVELLRAEGLTVAVVAVDPTSPFTGGALLGDRIRMERVALDPGVYIRSMATRGSLGGLAVATRETCDVLDGFGFDRILIETVGVGQSELDVARTADTSVVVLVPESGDSIQTLKAGVMEIADLFVVNKSDRPGADRLRGDIELMLGMRMGDAMRGVPAHHGVDLRKLAPADQDAAKKALAPARAAREATMDPHAAGGWVPAVVNTVGADGRGLPELLAAIDRHFEYLAESGGLADRRRSRMRERIVEVAEDRLRRRLWSDPATQAFIDEALPGLERGETTPFAIADALLARSATLMAGHPT